jgi:ABC-type branched-subunit amino acid transport system ATPase component
MITWGVVSAGMAAVVGPNSFIAVRFLLGVAQAGFFPGVILYLTYWFPAEQRARIIGICMVPIPVSGFIGSPISAALLGMDGMLGLQRGLVHVPEGKRLFPPMSMRDNPAMGAFLRRDSAHIRSDIDAMYARFPILKARHGQQAGSLSGGEQQILAFARGLMARPKLLLVDEPTVGLSPLMVKELSAALRAIRTDGVAILLVEQNAAMALRLASRGYLLETGICVAEDATRALMANDYVRKAYLGI